MKIFPKRYFLKLYYSKDLNEILSILDSWIDLVTKPNSPFLRQIASYHLRLYGSSYAPRIFKRVIADEMLRLNEKEDIRATINLAIIESYREFDPKKGTDLITWLSWRIPFHCSEWLTYQVTHPIEPFDESVLSPEIIKFEELLHSGEKVAIISQDLELSRFTKHYYLKGKNI